MNVTTGQYPLPAPPSGPIVHIAVWGASSLLATAIAQGVVALPGQIWITASPVHDPRPQPWLHPTVTIWPAVQVRAAPDTVRLHVRGTPDLQLGPASPVPPSPPHWLGR